MGISSGFSDGYVGSWQPLLFSYRSNPEAGEMRGTEATLKLGK